MKTPQTLHLAAKASETSQVFQSVPDAANEPRYVVGVAHQGSLESLKKLWSDPVVANKSYRLVGQRLCAQLNAALRGVKRVAGSVGPSA